jgi:DnaK suppressor protein
VLEAERANVLARLAELTREFDGIVAVSELEANDDEHDPEGATIGFERAQVSALITDARRQLDEVDAALARVAAGTYGVCEVCFGPIGPERLAARPTATRCITCASRGSGR